MYKFVLVAFFCLHVSYGGVYEKNCVACHKKMQVGIDKFFYRYLLVYSSKDSVKNAIKSYLLKPSKKTSLFAEDLVLRYGIKKPTKLSQKNLQKAIDLYWEKYNLIGKLQ